MEIILNSEQVKILLENIKESSLKSKLLKIIEEENVYNGIYVTNKYKINLSNDEKKTLLDELTFLITLIGVDQESEINKKGLLLESIIDVII